MDKLIEKIKGEKKLTKHYYGDLVRLIFLISAALMLLTLPIFYNRTPVSLTVSILTILSMGVLAGITNPVQKTTAIINTGISATALVAFEYYAVNTYAKESFSGYFFINQILALLFLISLYYSTKTLRSMIFKNDN